MKIFPFLQHLTCLLLATLTIAIFWNNLATTLILIIILAGLINFKAQKIDVLFYLIIAILATVLESIAMSTGAWTYATISIFNFPIWLPLYWGMSGIVIKDLYFLFKKKYF